MRHGQCSHGLFYHAQSVDLKESQKVAATDLAMHSLRKCWESTKVGIGKKRPVQVEDEDMNFSANKISSTLAFAGTSAALAWVIGLYFALSPNEVSWRPRSVTSGNLEWVSMICALGAGLWCLYLLCKAMRFSGVTWRAYAIGILSVGVTLLIMAILIYGLIH